MHIGLVLNAKIALRSLQLQQFFKHYAKTLGSLGMRVAGNRNSKSATARLWSVLMTQSFIDITNSAQKAVEDGVGPLSSALGSSDTAAAVDVPTRLGSNHTWPRSNVGPTSGMQARPEEADHEHAAPSPRDQFPSVNFLPNSKRQRID